MTALDKARNPGTQVIMLVLNDVTHDSRVRREASTLAQAGYGVRVIGTHAAGSPLPDTESHRGWTLHRFRYGRTVTGLRRFWLLNLPRHLWQAIALITFLRQQQAVIWHAHDYPALVLASLALTGRRSPGKLIYDTHELYFHRFQPRTVPGRLLRRLNLWIERILARRADAVLTVSPELADFLAAQWHTFPPTVILNSAISAPPDLPSLPRPVDARLWLVHTGSLIARGRRLPDLLRGLADTPADVHLTFLGEGPLQTHLQALAQALGIAQRVHFVPPVPPEQVSAAIRSADAAVIALDPTLPSYAFALPNKLFEAIAAGLPVLSTHTPALSRFYAQHPIGVLWESRAPDDFARATATLADPAARRQWQHAVQAAQNSIGWETQAQRLLEQYHAIMLLKPKTKEADRPATF